MNRLKLWLYLALLLCAGAANLVGVSRWLTHRAIAQVDRELNRSVAQVDARSQLLAAEAAQVADAVARDPAVLQALSAEEGSAASAAQSAAQSARGVAADAHRSQLVATSGRGGRSLTLNGAAVPADAQLESLLSGSAEGAVRREGYVVVGDALYYLVATPAGRGAAVAVGVPMNGAWLAGLRAGTGSDVTLLLDQRPPRGTLPAQQLQQVASAVRGAAAPVDVGSLSSQPASLAVSLPVPSLPLLFADAPAYRALAVALRGLAGGTLVLSQPTSALLVPVIGYQWALLAGLALLLLVGGGVALTLTNEQEAIVPKDLVAAADRITRRDFTARAPVMAGSLGTVAAALNCAAEAARSAGRAKPDAESALSLAREAGGEAPEAGDTGAPADVFAAFSVPAQPAGAAATALPESLATEPAAGEASARADVFDAFSVPGRAAEAVAAPDAETAAKEPAAGDASPSGDIFSAFARASGPSQAAAVTELEGAAKEPSAGDGASSGDILGAFATGSSPAEAAAATELEEAAKEPSAGNGAPSGDLFSAFARASGSAEAMPQPETAANEPVAAAAFSPAEEQAAAMETRADHSLPAGWPFTEGEGAASLGSAAQETAAAAATDRESGAPSAETLVPAAASELATPAELAPAQEPSASSEPAALAAAFAPAEAAGSALAAFAARLEQQAAAHLVPGATPAPDPLPRASAEPEAATQGSERGAPSLEQPAAPPSGIPFTGQQNGAVADALPEAAAASGAPIAEPSPFRDQPAPAPAAEPTLFPQPSVDEDHWRVTYDEFLKVRDQCGEARQTVPYDRFRQKLQKNRDQLVAKYGCRTVRFQVYVKEGKAALKASPVR